MKDDIRHMLNKIRESDNTQTINPEQDNMMAEYHTEDETKLKKVISGDGSFVSSIRPIVADNTVNWKVSLIDNQGRAFDAIFSTVAPTGFEISTQSYLILEDSLPFFRKLISFKAQWLQDWQIRLSNN